ncbi:putative RNA-directed DNA polymerase from transposon BS, partial [Stegodyphus mimosarum]
MGKLFERVISIRLTEHLEKFNLIEKLQFGFRRGHSTTHQVLNLIELITTAFNKKNDMAACFLDFEKAFDRVWHEGLIHKLTNFMLPYGFIKLSLSYLKRRSFQVRCGDTLSTKRIIYSGVPQGSVLGPIYFNIYINDLPQPLNTKVLKYADDTVAFVESRNPQNAINNLQLSINIISKWCELWKINLNPAKCSVILFRRYKTLMRVNTDIKINSIVINNPNSYKYLGVYIDKNLNFKEHISYILNKANAAFYSIYPIIGKKSKLNIKIKKMLYISLIRPIMFYACPAWSIANKTERKKLDVLQNKILRSIVNAPWFVRNSQIHNDMKILPMQSQILCTAHKFFENMKNSEYIALQEIVNYDPLIEQTVKRPRTIYHNARWVLMLIASSLPLALCL